MTNPEPTEIQHKSIDFHEAFAALQARLAELELVPSSETFAGAISGTWKIRYDQHSTVYLNVFSELRGDLIFFDRNWIVAGVCKAHSPNTGHVWEDVFQLEYSQTNDSLTWVSYGETQVFNNVSAPGSAIDMKFDVPNRRVLVRLKADHAFGRFWMFPNAFVVVQ